MRERSIRILVVDDDKAVRRFFARTLREADAVVDLAGSGAEAKSLVQSRSYDVVVSDVAMSDMDGIELLKLVHAHDADLPVVLVTGLPRVESAIDAVAHGAFRYLVKPVAPEALRGVVDKACQLRTLARFREEAVALFGETQRRRSHHSELQEHYERALESIYLLYQPIVRAPGSQVFAYEALVRSHHRELAYPALLLDAAEKLGELWKLGRKIRSRAAEDVALVPEDTLLFVNLHPDDLLDDELYHEAAPLSRVAGRTVLEVTERTKLESIDHLERRVDELRAMGFRVAIDDLGSGYAGLSSLVSLAPDYVKVDECLVRDVDRHPRKQSLLQSVLELGRENGLGVILEGVETREEARALIDMGADFLQGYFFGRPGPLAHPGDVPTGVPSRRPPRHLSLVSER